MPDIGAPQSLVQKNLSNVTMRTPPRQPQQSEAGEVDKEKLLNNLTGRKPESVVRNVKDHNKIGKDEFLKLLSHQLQNQDPMKPMDQNKFASELAQFSQLEQLANLNSKFDKFGEGKKLQEKFYAASMVGKRVVTSGSSVEFRGAGNDADILFSLDQKAKNVLVRILDKKGNILSEQWMENMGRGNHSVQWDGRTLDKSIASEGEYQAKITAWDENDTKFAVNTHSSGIVDSVSLVEGEPVLSVDGRQIYLRDVKSFHVAHDVKKSDNRHDDKGEGQDFVKPQPMNSPQERKQLEAYQKQQSVYD